MAKHKASPIQRALSIIYDEGLLVGVVGASVGSPEFSDMLDVMAGIQYNDFDGAKVARMLKTAAGYGVIVAVQFGRENSPVLYVMPSAGGNPEHIMAEVKKGYAPAEADPHGAWLRFWWD